MGNDQVIKVLNRNVPDGSDEAPSKIPMKERDFSTRARRSTRVVIRIPARINVVHDSGKADGFDAVTAVVNTHGARLIGKRLFEKGQAVELIVPSTSKAGKGKVIWVDPAPARDGNYEFAIELDEPANLWGMHFPPADWTHGLK